MKLKKFISYLINKIDMVDAIVKVKLISGEPQIVRMDSIDDYLLMELLLTGIEDDELIIKVDDDSIEFTLDTSKYSKDHIYHVNSFDFKLVSTMLEFRQFGWVKIGGVLRVSIRLKDESSRDAETIII